MKNYNYALLMMFATLTTACGSTENINVDKVEEQKYSEEQQKPKVVMLSEDGTNIILDDEPVESVALSNFDTLRPNDKDGIVESAAINPVLEEGWKQVYVNGVRVIDGDTVEVLITDQKSERVRLIGIDAPESKQNYGQESKKSLQKCVDDKDISIIYKDTDRYGRLLGKVMAGNTDCNFIQVAVGSAWHYKQYSNEQPNNDNEVYSDAEKVAKLHSSGLWSNPNHLEPWEYRKIN